MPLKPVSSGSDFASWLAEHRFTKVRAAQELKVSIGSINRWASLGNEPLPLKAQRLIMDYIEASAPKQAPGRPKKAHPFDEKGFQARRVDGTLLEGEAREALLRAQSKWFDLRFWDERENRWVMAAPNAPQDLLAWVLVQGGEPGSVSVCRPMLRMHRDAPEWLFQVDYDRWRPQDELLAERRRAELEQERQARIRAQAEKEKRIAALPPGLPSVPEGYFNTGGLDPNAPMAKIYVPFEDEAEIAELIKKLPD